MTRADGIHGTRDAVNILCRRNFAVNIFEIIINKNYNFAVIATLKKSHKFAALFNFF